MSIRHPKLGALLDILRPMGSAVLAYSGGVDSTLLLKALQLSGIRAMAVTGLSPTMPPRDRRDAERFAAEIGLEYRTVETNEMASEGFVRNSSERCFHCKDELFSKLSAIAREKGYAVLLDGSNADDPGDHRPGLRAARAHGVRSPLMEAGLGKRDIREISKSLGLPTWDKPASPCLSSRFPYGVRITAEALGRIARAEEFLREKGFQTLRVRDHGGLARIELPQGDISRVLMVREEIAAGLRALGFDFVSLDLEGFRSGSLNRMIQDEGSG